MTDKPASERQQVAQRIADKINELGHNNPFGGEVTFTKGPKSGGWYEVMLSIPRYLDGVVRVFAVKNIAVETNRNKYAGLNEAMVMAFLEEPINGTEVNKLYDQGQEDNHE